MDGHGDIPLISTCLSYRDNAELVQYLAENGADVHRTGLHRHITPAHAAASMGNILSVKALLEAGHCINVMGKPAYREMRQNTLYKAVSRSKLDMLILLLENGVDVNAVTEGGETALEIAAGEGFYDIAQVPINAGAEFQPDDESFMRAMGTAGSHGHIHIASLLEYHRKALSSEPGQAMEMESGEERRTDEAS